MKTKKEIMQEFSEKAQENLLAIEISTEFVQNKYAQTNDQHLLQELAKLKANETETKDWVEFLKEKMGKE